MNSDGLLDNKTILDELADTLPRVSNSNLVSLIRIKPYAVLTTTGYGCGEPLLQL